MADVSETYNKEDLLLSFFFFFFKQGRKTSFSKAFRERKSVKAKPDSPGKVKGKLLIEMNGHCIAAENEILPSE